jgi:hypothetical protein
MRQRTTEKSLYPARERSEKMLERITEMNKFLDKFDGEFWKMVTEDLETRIRVCVGARDAKFAEMTEAELKAVIAEERAYRIIRDLPSRVLATRDNLVKERRKLTQELNERASRIKS